MLELPLDLNGASVEANEAQCLLFLRQRRELVVRGLSDMLREGAAATLFTEGELPYQCVCCHLLHSFRGQRGPVSPKLVLQGTDNLIFSLT